MMNAYIPEIETMPLSKQKSWQEAELKNTLRYIANYSPFYKKMFLKYHINVENIKYLEDLVNLPTTTKEDLQVYNWDFLAAPKQSIRELTATSGTLGSPVTIALTQKDLDRLAYNEYLSLSCMNTMPGDVFQLMLTLDRQFMAGMAYYHGIQRKEGAAVRIGAGLPLMQWNAIKRYSTRHLIGVPTFFLQMLEYANEQNIDIDQYQLQSLLAIGESVRDENLTPNSLTKRIQDKCDLKIYGTYASTEMQTAFTECSAGMGGHHHPELIIVELIDEEGNPVPKGTVGEVCITTLGVEGMPLLRYRTGDLCNAYYEPIESRKTMRLGPVMGRKKQMVKYKGTTVFPAAITNLLNERKDIQEYAIELNSDDNQNDLLKIYIQTKKNEQQIISELITAFRTQVRVVPEIVFIEEEKLRKMILPNLSRKPQRWIDLRQEKIER